MSTKLVNFSPLKLVEYTDVRHFDSKVGKWMNIREAENCYLLGQLPRLVAKAQSNGTAQGPNVRGAGGRRHSGRRILFEGGSLCVTWLSHEMIDVLVVGLVNAACQAVPVHGPEYSSWQVAHRWAHLLNRHCEIHRAERLYQLTRLAYVPPQPGRLVEATQEDFALVRRMDGGISEGCGSQGAESDRRQDGGLFVGRAAAFFMEMP